MTKPNFQSMSRKELRSYMLAHRDDDDAFYAYMDKLYEADAAIEAAVFEWLQTQNSHHSVTKIPEKSFNFVITDKQGNEKLVNLQIMMSSSLPTHKPFIEILIEYPAEDNRKNFGSMMTVFVGKNETKARELDEELTEANFDIRAKSSRVVGYVDTGGEFQTI